MHRIIMGAKPGEIVDNIDRNKLNNQRSNLRIVSKEENVHNQQKRTGTANNYKGTQYVKRLRLWQARCRILGNDFFLGYYTSEIAAAYAYNKKASKISDTILLNKLDLTVDALEEMLLSHIRPAPVAAKTSRYMGVRWHKGRNAWTATITVSGVRRWLGGFDSEVDAADAVTRALGLVDKESILRRAKVGQIADRPHRQ